MDENLFEDEITWFCSQVINDMELQTYASFQLSPLAGLWTEK